MDADGEAGRPFGVRPAREDDRASLARLFAAVAEERNGIAAEPPVDVARRAAAFDLDSTIVADAAGDVVGGIWIDGPIFGFGEIGMLVARDWRGRGVGTALMEAAIAWARSAGSTSCRSASSRRTRPRSRSTRSSGSRRKAAAGSRFGARTASSGT